MTGGAGRLQLVILAVADLPAAAAFWDAAFGWEVAVDVPVYREYRLPGGTGVSLYDRHAFSRNTGLAPAAAPGGAITAAELYVRVEDLAAACARVEAAGGRLLSPAGPRPWGDEAAYYADPDGNVVAVAKPLP